MVMKMISSVGGDFVIFLKKILTTWSRDLFEKKFRIIANIFSREKI
jgi:hypothetical protein